MERPPSGCCLASCLAPLYSGCHGSGGSPPEPMRPHFTHRGQADCSVLMVHLHLPFRGLRAFPDQVISTLGSLVPARSLIDLPPLPPDFARYCSWLLRARRLGVV